MSEELKKQVASAALSYVPRKGIVGLGTGSTAKHFISGVAELIRKGYELSCVPTSEQSRAQAEALGIPLLSPEGPWQIDVTVDGADEVSRDLDLIKGGGAAHTREKIVNHASRLNIIVVDESKLSERLGEKWSVPIEVLRFAHGSTRTCLARFGTPVLRERDGSPVLTDSGHLIYDLKTGPIDAPAALDHELKVIPGVVETGLFCGRAGLVLSASSSGVSERRPGQSRP